MKTLGVITLATIVGLVVLLILTTVIFILVAWFIQTSFPTRPRTGLGVSDPGLSLLVLFVIYFFNSLIASFIAGFLIHRWGQTAGSQAWQSFISGLLISLAPPFSLSLVSFSGTRADSIAIAVITLPSGIAGLVGYYVAGRKYRRRVFE